MLYTFKFEKPQNSSEDAQSKNTSDKLKRLDDLEDLENFSQITHWFIKEAEEVIDNCEQLDSVKIKKTVINLLDALAEKAGKEKMKGVSEQYIDLDESNSRTEYWLLGEKLNEDEAREIDPSDITEDHWDLKLFNEIIADCYRHEQHLGSEMYIKSWSESGLYNALHQWIDLLKKPN